MKRMMLKFFDRTNPIMIWILTSRLHFLLSSGLCVIEYEGRRSGKTFRLPVGYHDLDGVVIVSTTIAPERNWWRNFSTPRPARLRVKGNWRSVVGRVLEPGTDEFRDRVEQVFRRGKVVSRAMGVSFDPAVGLTDEAVAFLRDNSCVTLFE